MRCKEMDIGNTDCDDYMWVGSGPAPDPACEFIDPICDDPYTQEV